MQTSVGTGRQCTAFHGILGCIFRIGKRFLSIPADSPRHASVHQVTTRRYGFDRRPLVVRLDADTPVRVGSIVTLARERKYPSAVVIGFVDHPDTVDDVAVATPYALTPAQLELARWMASHYVVSLGLALTVFVSQAMFPALTVRWHASNAGIEVQLGELPPPERVILYVLRKNGAHTTSELAAVIAQTPEQLTDVLTTLVQRGYVDAQYEPATVPQRQTRETAFTVDAAAATAAAAWIAASKHRSAVIAAYTSGEQPAQRSGGYSAARRALIERGVLVPADEPPAAPPLPRSSVALTAAQNAVVAAIRLPLSERRYAPFLVYGVTGSGKTEIYFALIDDCIATQRQVLVLVPEIALTTQLAQRFEARFPGRVAVIHGEIPLAQRHAVWAAAQRGEISIVLGPRSALSVPLPALGLVVVDEEHDASYKANRAPLINARDCAMVYARAAQVPVVLGSATPSVELMHAGDTGTVSVHRLPERVGSDGAAIPRPPIRVVDMRSTATVDLGQQISTELNDRICATLAQPAQVMLLLNRRGSTGSRLCTLCGTVERCPRCSTPLVSHGLGGQTESLCHTCGHRQPSTRNCRECFGSAFLEYGGGTQRVVQWLRTAYPGVPVFQWDRDSADSARAHASLLHDVSQHAAAVIVGTQMIAKGLDLPNVRLVGVINTDLGLNLPDFRAAERTFQLLTQVAGRAGRRAGESSVVFQSYTPDNYAIQAAARYDAAFFYEQELAYRAYLEYPPYTRMAKLVWQHSDADACRVAALDDAEAIRGVLAHTEPEVRLVGPAPAFFHRVRERYSWQALLVGPRIRSALYRIATVHRATIDVDPVSLL